MGSMIPKEIKYNLHYDDVLGDLILTGLTINQIFQQLFWIRKDCRYKTRILTDHTEAFLKLIQNVDDTI